MKQSQLIPTDRAKYLPGYTGPDLMSRSILRCYSLQSMREEEEQSEEPADELLWDL